MDLCTHAHEIIRTWLFSRVVRAHFENGVAPVDARDDLGLDRSTPTARRCRSPRATSSCPTEILDKFGADAVRWRAAMARPGLDSPFDESQMKVGPTAGDEGAQRLQVRPRQRRGHRPRPAARHRAGRPRPARSASARCAGDATAAFDAYDYTTALEVTEKFFWEFCDDYLELVKERAYADGGPAPPRPRRPWPARCTRSCACSRPSCPTSTEEVWSWWQDGSVHHASWPTGAGLQVPGGDPAVLDAVAAALTGIRGAKSEAKASMRAELSRVEITGPEALVASGRDGCGRSAQGRQDHRFRSASRSTRAADDAARRRRAGACGGAAGSRRARAGRRPWMLFA